MEFVKMHGLGNDFIVVYGRERLPGNAADMAVRLCDRNFGIGADGLVFILPSQAADFQMRIINADGSEAEQCGNAIRCVAKYVYDRGLTRGEQLSVETLGAGRQTVQIQAEQGVARTVTVDMGEPVLEDGRSAAQREIEAAGRTFLYTPVSMGNPHCVIFVEDAPSFELGTYGPALETHQAFPNRTNVEFVTVRTRGHADMRVWERGAGPTLACGTGACATLVAAHLNGLTDRRATIALAGGDLDIEWREADNRIYMTGPAAEVYKGEVRDEA